MCCPRSLSWVCCVSPQERVYAALDAGVICTVGMVANGSPRVIPTGYVRLGDYVYLHGKVTNCVWVRHGSRFRDM